MKRKEIFKLLAIKAIGNGIFAGTIVLAALGITLLVMMVMVTIGTVFALALPYKPIAALVAITALVVLTVFSTTFVVRAKDKIKSK
jgi:hypothetical protein